MRTKPYTVALLGEALSKLAEHGFEKVEFALYDNENKRVISWYAIETLSSDPRDNSIVLSNKKYTEEELSGNAD